MKKQGLLLIIGLNFCIIANSQQKAEAVNWTVQKPFEQFGFIENNGQFSQGVLNLVQKPILYYTKKGKIKLYYAANSVVFTYDSLVTGYDVTDNKETDRPNAKLVPYSFSMSWEGANTCPQIEPVAELDNYYTFSNPKDKSGKTGIRASAWSKLIYRNVYKGIDVVFYYPKDKGGIEYDIIVHPGADVSAFKMKYCGADVKLSGNNIVIISPFAEFTDHQPSAISGRDGSSLISGFKVHGNTVSFDVESYDKSQLLVIDPWTTSIAFTGNNSAYDLDYDNRNNVYISGGGDLSEYEICKYNSAGILQWTYSATFADVIGGYYYYGGLTVDHRSGTSYFSEGADNSITGCQIVKVNALGSQTGLFTGDPGLMEMWRIGFDYCNNNLVIAGGNPSNKIPQAAILDSNLTTLSIVNVLGATDSYHDMALLALDGFGNSYMATTNPVGGLVTAAFDNIILKLPLPSLIPTAYMQPDGHNFYEISSMPYYPGAGGTLRAANGFNGMAVNKTILVTYDGKELKKWRPSTGAYVDSVSVSGTYFTWGGLDMDCRGNIYVGGASSVKVYDSTLTLKSTYAVSNNVYDLKVRNQGVMYVCGNGFVSAVNIPTENCFDSSCTNVAGINTISNPASVIIYPNPNTGHFTITAKGMDGNAVLKVYDVLGQEVYTKILPRTQNDYNIDLSNQAKGIYLYRILSEKEEPVSTGKLVIQ